MIIFTYPNLAVFNGKTKEGRKGRGSLDERKIKVDNINQLFNTNDVQIIEIPADFIKNSSEETETGLPPCSILDSEAVAKLYDKPKVKYPYILHTEPELSRSKCSISSIASLNWYDLHWVNDFLNQIFAIIGYFEQKPFAIEIHPGKPQKGKNNYRVYSSAIKFLFDSYFKKYSEYLTILIENRTGSFIQNGDDILNFWKLFSELYNDLKDNVGIVLDIQQLFTCSDGEFDTQLNKVPIEAIRGFHIHRKHGTPKSNDGINWELVSKKIKLVEERQKKVLVLPEVHHEKQLEEAYKFCKENLKI